MSKWGKTPPDIITKLARHGYDDPEDLPDNARLEKILGKSYARVLREEIAETSSHR